MPRSRLRYGRALFLTLPLFSAWACGGTDEEKLRAAELAQGCTVNSDCKKGLVCTFQRCHQECREDRDCQGEERCVKGTEDTNVCQLPDDTACVRTSQCQGDQVCGVDKECRDVCETNKDCSNAMQICAASGECASTETDKDIVNDDNVIEPDPFDDTKPPGGGEGGAGGGNGTGGNGTGGNTTGGVGSGGKSGTTGGVTGEGGAGGSGATSGGDAGGAGGGGGVVGTGGSGGDGGAPTGECPANLGDCDKNGSCETALNLITSCGACDVTCDPVHGKVKCDPNALMCIIDETQGGCDANYDDCNDDAADGCEAALQTDAEHCGQCGRSCGTGTCAAGRCLAEVLMKPVNVTGISHSNTGQAFLIGNQLLKLNTDNGTQIRTVTLPPSSPPAAGEELAKASSAIYSVYADATNLYYGLSGTPPNIFYKPLSGVGAEKVAAVMPSTYAYTITGSGTALYMVDWLSPNYRILTVPKPTGTAQPTAGVIAGLDTRKQIHEVIVAGTRLFWVESSTPVTVFTAPLAGGTPVALDTTVGAYPTYVRFAADNQYVYWSTYNGTSSKVRRVAVAGSPTDAAVEDVAVGLNAPSPGIAVDGSYVYFYTSYQIFRVAKDASDSPESLVNLNVAPYFYNLFAVDSGYVYGTGQSGELLRVSKIALEGSK